MNAMLEYYKKYWQNYVNFQGRARRSEYWYPMLCNIIVAVVLGILATLTSLVSVFAILISLFSLAILLPSLSVEIRRLHDIGKSGWWLFIALVPMVGGILLLVWFCTDSNPGENQYGPNPKGV